ncbi:D-psicose 3-epimerase [Terrilactibacillus laevilacticus]|uniref:Sugar phosphate isomerase/epimerase family protein n=1 Tax=Terrilactibacillus laevilacticus TaxID=1380157 RepID=A0ABW5PRS4_9BACI|nr:sugar phosphate isomerase/epimerase family protein [Terrilactibacillus laevilacticus]
MKYGVHFGYFTQEWNTDIKPLIPRAANLGFDVLEVGPFPAMIQQDYKEMDEVNRIADENNIELTYCMGLSSDINLNSSDDATREKGIRTLQTILQSIDYMGGNQLSGILYGEWPALFTEVKSMNEKKQTLARVKASLREVLKTAEERDIMCSLEVVNRFEQWLLNSVDEGMAFIKELNHPNCTLLLDTFHMNIEEDDTIDAIRRAGEADVIGHFHVVENNRKVPHAGSKKMDWTGILQALKSTDYQGRIVFEPFVKPEGPIGKDIRIWRDLSHGADRIELDRQLKDGLEFVKATYG